MSTRALSDTNTARLVLVPANLGFGNVGVGRRRIRTLTPSPSSLNFENVQIGNGQQLSETVTNTGRVNVSISQARWRGDRFQYDPMGSVGANPRTALHIHRRFCAALRRKFLGKCCDCLERVKPESVHTAQRYGYARAPGTVVRVSHNPGLRQRDRGNEWPTKRDSPQLVRL